MISPPNKNDSAKLCRLIGWHPSDVDLLAKPYIRPLFGPTLPRTVSWAQLVSLHLTHEPGHIMKGWACKAAALHVAWITVAP